MIRMYWVVIGITIAALSLSGIAFALDCPGMPAQTTQDGQGKVSLAVGRIAPVKGADLEVKARSITNNLVRELPNTDRLHLEQMMLSSYCSALRDDKSLTESEKADRIKAYNETVHRALFNKGKNGTKVTNHSATTHNGNGPRKLAEAEENGTHQNRLRAEIKELRKKRYSKEATVEANLEKIRNLNKERAVCEANCKRVDTVIDLPTQYTGEEPKRVVIQEEDIYSCQKALELQNEVELLREKNALLQKDIEAIDKQIADPEPQSVRRVGFFRK